MYSNNDFRSYSENHLEHRHKSPYAGGFTADGKNTSAYNHDYYIKNLWRWGVEKAGDVADAAKEKINNALDKTDLDERAAEAMNNAKNTVKDAYRNSKRRVNQAINNSNTKVDDRLRDAYRSAKAGNKAATGMYLRSAGKAAASETRQAIDRARSDARYKTTTAKRDARVKADVTGRDIQRNVSDAAQKFQSDARYKTTAAARNARVNADLAGRNLRRNVDSAVDSVKDRINTAVRNSNTKIDDNLLGAARALKNRDTNAAKNHLSNVGREIANTPGNIKNRVNEAIDNSNTKVDDRLRSAYGAAKSGNKAATGMYLRSAGKEAVKDINNAIDRSSTRIDDNLRGAYRAAKAGDTSAARTHLGNAGREIGKDAKDLARNAAGAVIGAGKAVRDEAYRVGKTYPEARFRNPSETQAEQGAKRRTSNQGPNYNPREVGSSADLNGRRQEQYQNSVNKQTGRLNRTAATNTNTARDNGTLTPHQKNRQDNSIPQWFENYAKSVGGNAKRASKEIQKYLKEVQKHGADSRQAQEARADAMSAVTSALEPNRNVSDSGTRSSYNDTNKQQRARNTQQKEQIATNTTKPSTSSDDSNDKEFYDNWYYDPHLGVYRLDNSEHRAQVAEENAKKERMRNEFINDTQNVVDNLGRTNVERLLDAIADVGKATKKKKR